MKKFVWLNMNNGEFSNSWNEKDYAQNSIVWETINKELEELKIAPNGWKLIEYTCKNDETFDFYNKMKIVTRIKGNNGN